MGLFTKIKKKVGDMLNTDKENPKRDSKLKEAQDEFIKDRSQYDISSMDDREKLYIGTHGVDDDVNQKIYSPNGGRLANNVINVIYELIESQIDTTIPMPSVRSKREGNEYLQEMIENSIKNDLLESDINRINDENERTTPVQGFSVITIDWNPDFEHHLYRGEIEIDNKHPKCLLPQPGVFNIQRMDHFHLISSVTKDFIKRRYNVEMPDDGESYPEYNSIDGESDNNNTTENMSVITKWYRKDGRIGKFVWCNDTILEDMPDYFARRIDGKIEEYETVVGDMPIANGKIIPAGTKIKYFCPTRYPVVIRKNVPLPFNFGGQSDVDVIRDQADCIKKVVSTIEEKILKGGVILKALNGHKFDTSNDLYQIVRGEINELNMLGTMDLNSNIQQDLEFFAQQYKSAKDTLGVTDSFQGKPDRTAQSGLAKQIQVFQSSGRMQSKLFNKKNSFKELFEIMFEFKLAFYDEIRPFIKSGVNGQPEYGEFNKYDFLEQDDAGEWYYNTDFLFSADAGEGIPKDKMWLMNQTLQFVSSGLMNKIQFWSAMEKLQYPGASEYKKAAIEEQQMLAQQQQQMQQQQMEMQQQQAAQEQAKAEADMIESQRKQQVEMQDKTIDKNMQLAKLIQDQQKIDNQNMKGGGSNG